MAHLECGVVGATEQGDHTLFLAEVLAAWADEDAFEEHWQPEHELGRLLHHLGGRTTPWASAWWTRARRRRRRAEEG